MSQRLKKYKSENSIPGNRACKRDATSSGSLSNHYKFKRETKIARSRRKRRNNKEIRKITIVANGSAYKKVDKGWEDTLM